MEDRFARGFIAGMLAGVPSLIFNWIVFLLNLSLLRWADFMAIMAYGRKPEGTFEIIFAQIAIFFFLGLLGAVFAYLLPALSSRNHLLKAWVFGVFVWFASFSITQLAGIPELSLIPLVTTAANFIGASIWGLALGLAFRWLESRVGT